MSKTTEEKKERFVFVKDNELSATDFPTFEEADKHRQTLLPEGPNRRIRVRYRNRTGNWDVIVKVKQEVKQFMAKQKLPAAGEEATS